MTKPLVLTKLTIERERWGDNAGKLTGKAYFDSDTVGVNINITDEHCRKILELSADELIETAKEMAEVMRGNIIEGTVEKKGWLK